MSIGREKLEELMNNGTKPTSVSQLFKMTGKIGSIKSPTGTIYFIDIPDEMKPSLPNNLKRHCKNGPLNSPFNRWMWEVGCADRDDLAATWDKNPTVQIAWRLLDTTFSDENNASAPTPDSLAKDATITAESAHIPTCEDIQSIIRKYSRIGDRVSKDTILDWYENDTPHDLQPGWREIVCSRCTF